MLQYDKCNSQAEVFNKTLAKYLKTVVDETNLNWEWYLAPLMFSYNTSYHSTTKTTLFNLLYGMKPRLPSFPVEELQRQTAVNQARSTRNIMTRRQRHTISKLETRCSLTINFSWVKTKNSPPCGLDHL